MKELSIYETLREEYPEYISKEQLYKICHISKRKASYLLESGLIPCKNSGKQTRKYTIALRDVACFLEQRKNRPAKYETPPQLKAKRKDVYSKIKLDSEEYTTALRQFYINMLATVNDVLTINEVSEITGYSSSSIVKWVSGEKLRSIYIRNRYYIPKEYLLDFMVGQYYWRIAQKSPKHIADFAVFDKEYSEH